MHFKSRPENLVATALSALVLLVVIVLMNLFLFDLKPLLHWDELIRYAYPGVQKKSFNLGEVFSVLFSNPDNGRTINFILRILRTILPGDSAFIFAVYKTLIVVFNAFGLLYFSHKMLISHWSSKLFSFWPLFLMAGFLVSPGFWLQANEIMCEPLAAPLTLIWLASVYCLPPLDFQNPKYRKAFLKLLLLSLGLILTSLQFFIIESGIAALTFGVLELMQQKEPLGTKRIKKALRKASVPGLSCLATAILWVLTRDGRVWPLIEYMRNERHVIYPTLRLNMNTLQIYTFGLRTFAWFYLPVLPLCAISAYWWVRHFQKQQPSIQFALICALLHVLTYIYLYQNNLQERYFHISNTFLLIAALYGCYQALISSLARTKKLAPRIAFILGIMIYSVVDYSSIFVRLPACGTMTSGSYWRGDRADAEEARTAFGLIKRSYLVEHPHLKYTYIFFNRVNGFEPEQKFYDIVEKIKGLLAPGVTPVVLKGAPSYYTQATVWLQYLDKFGEPPPSRTNQILLISLSLPKGSIHNSVIYTTLSSDSEEKAMEAWQKNALSLPRGHEMILDEKTKDYRLLVARANLR